ncbi:hypothetical protein CSUI_004600 [Cystoisospora suis]|uniref:Uncharacterized protein n=1 Tax=Cystoisospora suis TaxID=483139 RepID=A0A2C6L0E5_9APIC|nr:hypothetical protein CSUI_004600 [Cystoisospora suis]
MGFFAGSCIVVAPFEYYELVRLYNAHPVQEGNRPGFQKRMLLSGYGTTGHRRCFPDSRTPESITAFVGQVKFVRIQ